MHFWQSLVEKKSENPSNNLKAKIVANQNHQRKVFRISFVISLISIFGLANIYV